MSALADVRGALLTSICPPGSNETRAPRESSHDGGSGSAGLSHQLFCSPTFRMMLTEHAAPGDSIGTGRRVSA
jgi:hypothetical protein